ncbi:hypothetical protein SGFS_065480 [Streptomyces graminofaciens]|uniref:Uncharacterized protein n=1 Tax=Streptomyces graminofaciens TaxID=68212 RepID=A0ABM7FFD0_9ACTN|nr:hypothetical protein [Streptomyces graminofaciens]BBC35254.1 hypothetical protein SGFS_065480 [Streptomyces graminofaciens]
MTQPTIAQLRNLTNRAGAGLTPGEQQRLRDGIDQLHERAETADEAARRALAQRQEMAEERYAWQERGDRAEAKLTAVAGLIADHEGDEWAAHPATTQLRAALNGEQPAVPDGTDTTEPAWTPPPPGDTREQLPDHLLDLIRGSIPDYTSTACVTAYTLAVAVHWSHPRRAELGQWAERMHARCRTNQKFTGQLCACGCHQPGPA